MIKNCDRRIK